MPDIQDQPVPQPEPDTVTVDNLVYRLDQLPPRVQEMVAMINIWRADLVRAQENARAANVEVTRQAYAVNGLQAEAVQLIRASNTPPVRDLNAALMPGQVQAPQFVPPAAPVPQPEAPKKRSSRPKQPVQ